MASLDSPRDSPRPPARRASLGARVGVLALQGDVREHALTLEALGSVAVPVRRASELAGIDGLILPGGESTTIDKLTRIFGLAEPLKDAMRNGMPMYGSCAGMIMLADRIADPSCDQHGNPQQTIGGLDMVVRRNAFGRQRESFETTLRFEGLDRPDTAGDDGPGTQRREADTVQAVFIRAPWVEKVGDGVRVLASIPAADIPDPGNDLPAHQLTPAGVARIVAVRSGTLLATSFHPEVTGERRVHELFIRMIRGEA